MDGGGTGGTGGTPQTQSGTSSGTSANSAAAVVLQCKIPVAKDEVLWIQLPDGTFKLNAKVSPVEIPDGMEFEGDFWEGEQAYAYFR